MDLPIASVEIFLSSLTDSLAGWHHLVFNGSPSARQVKRLAASHCIQVSLALKQTLEDLNERGIAIKPYMFGIKPSDFFVLVSTDFAGSAAVSMVLGSKVTDCSTVSFFMV